MFPAGHRLLSDARRGFADRSRALLNQGSVEVQVGDQELLLQTTHGIWRDRGSDLHRYLGTARIRGLALDADTSWRALGELLGFFCACLDQPELSIAERQAALWQLNLTGVMVHFAPADSAQADAIKNRLDLSSLIPDTPLSPGERNRAERELHANLPLQLGSRLLDELQGELSAGLRQAALATLGQIEQLLIERHDVATLAWLLDELDRHPAITTAERHSLDQTWQTDASAPWFERCLTQATAVTQQALASLLIRIPDQAARRLVQELEGAPEHFPILATVTATLRS